MGRVYRAEQAMLGRTVAIKVIHPHLLGDDQTVARFYNEARAASRLNHPASVSIIDFGRTEDGILYLVMEHLEGFDLAHVLAEEGPLPYLRICRVVRHILSALGEAHALGVVHRDLKPENIIVRKVRRGAEQIKVVDFGLAHIIGPGGTSITTPGLVCGTPDYMSPEQGRGESVDGRGDLYSVGVLLFELLADRLPFEDDTPTKVVFRHIHDPVPDPREVSPQRNIPDPLAEIALRALRKKADERYQSADEMYEALSKEEDRLAAERTTSLVVCPSCAHKNPSDQRFCGSCGARLGAELPLASTFRSSSPPEPIHSVLPGSALSPLVGREAEIARLIQLRDRSEERSVSVALIGEPGVGKSRLLDELGARLVVDGDAVAAAGPHPSSAPVPYWPIRRLLSTLLDVDEDRLAELADSAAIGDPIARAGIAEALRPTGLEGRKGKSRAEAVAVALAAAVRVAAGRSKSGRVALLVDDLARCDSLSAEALTRLTRRMAEGPLFLVSAIPKRGMKVDDEVVKFMVRGLELDPAQAMLEGDEGPADRPIDRETETPPQGRVMLPLYLEQLRRLGVTSLDNDDALPARLADAVLARLERLDIAGRRLLQAICVLGDAAPLEWVGELVRGDDMSAMDALESEGLVTTDEAHVRVSHPFVRELVEASIPAEYRKELHAVALQVVAGNGAPLEVRAEHAWRAAEPMSALLLLEQMGDAALRRGDGKAAVLSFRRGLEFARRELLMTGETALDRAIVTFSRKLGDAMDRAGETTAADGVLREALELAGPANRERPRMLMVLSRVATRRNRPRDATRFLGKALELSARQKDRLGEAEANLALGKLRLHDGDARTALNTLAKAIELAGASGPPALVVDAHMARAEALRDVGDEASGQEQLVVARRVAEASGKKALIASVVAALGAACDAAGDVEGAVRSYREAGRLASEAGDAEGAQLWLRSGRVSQARQAG